MALKLLQIHTSRDRQIMHDTTCLEREKKKDANERGRAQTHDRTRGKLKRRR